MLVGPGIRSQKPGILPDSQGPQLFRHSLCWPSLALSLYTQNRSLVYSSLFFFILASSLLQCILHTAARVIVLQHKSGHVPTLLRTLPELLVWLSRPCTTWPLPASPVTISCCSSSFLGSPCSPPQLFKCTCSIWAPGFGHASNLGFL